MDRLPAGAQLNRGAQLTAGNGRTRLVMQADGNLVLYRVDDGHALWSSGTAGQPANRAVMQADGNLVARATDGRVCWASNTAGNPGAQLVLQDDGNLVIYANGGGSLWSSKTVQWFGPVTVPDFLPSTRAPRFANGPWPQGTQLSISVAGLPSAKINATRMGLCGGMSFLTRDIVESGTPQLRGTQADRIPVALAQHILGRLLDSFSGPAIVARWLALTSASDEDTVVRGDGVFHQTSKELPRIIGDVTAGRLCPIGLVLTQSYAPWAVFQNHVVVVWGYEQHGDTLTLRTYDCNRPRRDDITIKLDIGSPTTVKPITTNGTDMDSASGRIRGFFRLPYRRKSPAAAYIDDATVTLAAEPAARMAPGARVAVRLVAANTGSTTWTRQPAYQLGSQAPPDNATWGVNRTAVSGNVDPGQNATFTLNVTAPANAGSYDFGWRMRAADGKWFGTASSTLPITVSPD